MIDIKFLRENPDIVKENIRRKFQDEKLALVDEVIALDAESRRAKQEGDDLRAARKRISKEIGTLMKQGKTEEAESKKAEVNAGAAKLEELEKLEGELQEKVNKIMMVIPNIIDPSVPVGLTMRISWTVSVDWTRMPQGVQVGMVFIICLEMLPEFIRL